MTRPPPNDINLYGDVLYGIHIPYSRRRFPIVSTPPTVIKEPRPAWHNDEAAVIRLRLSRLQCDEVTHVNGVHVQRSDAYARVTFHVNADTLPDSTTFKRYSIDDAVARIQELAA